MTTVLTKAEIRRSAIEWNKLLEEAEDFKLNETNMPSDTEQFEMKLRLYGKACELDRIHRQCGIDLPSEFETVKNDQLMLGNNSVFLDFCVHMNGLGKE